jgi:hypothetical protein
MPKKLTTEEFINKGILKHNNFYDYSKVIYKNSKSNIIITCPEHGDFKQLSNNHLQGHGCEKCAGNRILTTEEFINRSKSKHGNLYDYSKVDYKNNRISVIIICKKHGKFEQNPFDHLKGHGCMGCSGSLKLTTEEFIKRANLKHDKFYDYSKVVYKNNISKVIITCRNHGDFLQIPKDHLRGVGCDKCTKRYSKISINWINYLQNSINKEIQNMLSPLGEYRIPTTNYLADGYCKETNTIYEFHGDIWHGNPKLYNENEVNPVSKKTYGELYQFTQIKKNKIIELGYNYVEIWENDWKRAVKAVIKIQRLWRKYFYKNIPA